MDPATSQASVQDDGRRQILQLRAEDDDVGQILQLRAEDDDVGGFTAINSTLHSATRGFNPLSRHDDGRKEIDYDGY